MMTRKRSNKNKVRRNATLFLPQDVLVSILIRLSGSDLRRLRRVCKQWKDTISDPTFIHAHMVQKPQLPPTHTIVFFPGSTYSSCKEPQNGRGFLFDEHWRLTAELAIGMWDELIGACNGLLCFLESGQGSIKIVEPFTGESLVVPLPLEALGLRWTVNPAAYCFGFDATSRRYKIVHHDYLKYSGLRERESVNDEELHVYTVGSDKGWTRVHVARKVYGAAYGDPSYVEGVVYWPARGYGERDRDEKLVRFDLATEKVTLEAVGRLRLDAPRAAEMADFCRLVDSTPIMMTYGRQCEWDAWFPQAEHMKRNLEFGPRKVLFEVSKDQPAVYNYNGRASFVPARRHQQLPIAGGPPRPSDYSGNTFGYTPTVSAAPLALYIGTPSP